MKKLNFKFLLILSCLILTATQLVFGQNEFNKRPFQDFAASLNNKIDNKEVDLDKPFSVTLEGYLTKEGTFDAKRSKFTKAEGDEKMVAVAKDGIEALSDSRMLYYLSDLEIEQIIVNVVQNETNFLLTFNLKLPTAEKAKVISSGLSAMLAAARIRVSEETEKVLLNSAIIQPEDKNCLIRFALPKEEAHTLLKNELQKVKEKSYSN